MIEKVSDRVAGLLAAALTIFQIYTALYMPLPGMAQRAVHLGLGLAIVYLYYPRKRPEKLVMKNLSYIFGIFCALLALTACLNVGAELGGYGETHASGNSMEIRQDIWSIAGNPGFVGDEKGYGMGDATDCNGIPVLCVFWELYAGYV